MHMSVISIRYTRYSIALSTVQYSTVQYSTVQYSTVQYSTVQYSSVQYVLFFGDSEICKSLADLACLTFCISIQ
jgi:hypothetical protein